MIRMTSILFPTDFSPSSEYAQRYAVSFAKEYGAKLYVLHVIEEMTYAVPFDMLQAPPLADFMADLEVQAQKALNEVLPEEMREALEWEPMVRRGVAFYEILRAARELDVDLIVCGTHGRTGLKHMLFGSVAEKVVRKAPCPVLSVRHPEQKFEWPGGEEDEPKPSENPPAEE